MTHSPIIAIGDILVSSALLMERFACDVAVCKGQCCIDGESGAPLEREEVDVLIREYDTFAPFMTSGGREAVRQQGVAILDGDGDWVTPLIAGAECAYARLDEAGICRCAIEHAFYEATTAFRKPISCRLYPIRIAHFSTGIALNYHRWHLCIGACVRGQREQIPVYRFLKDAIIDKFGVGFYEELDALLPPHSPHQIVHTAGKAIDVSAHSV